MKYIFLVIHVLFTASFFAQNTPTTQPEKVHSIIKGRREPLWYEEQLALWSAELKNNSKYGDAWLNSYAAARALRNISTDENAKSKYDALCKKVVEDCSKAMPNTFENHFLNYAEFGGPSGDQSELLKAAAIRPYDEELLDDMLIYHAINRNETEFTTYGQRMFEGNDLSSGLLNWAYNILAELDQNAILFTAGDNDTFATWLIQAVKKFRKDVTVVNTYLITIDSYRNNLFAELGYDKLNVTLQKDNLTQQEYDLGQEAIFQHIFNGKRPVYVSASAQGIFDQKYSSKLYLTGLALKYSETPFDNTSIIRRNYEKRYLIDYLKETFAYNISNPVGESFNAMYLPSMIKLYQHYSESEELVKKQELESLMLRVAEQTGQQEDLVEIFSKEEKPNRFLSTILDLKSLEKNMVSLNEKVFINKYEVSNGEYRLFLKNLDKSGQMSLYQQYCYDSTQWVKGEFAKGFSSPMENLYHWHPAYANYPTVNISYEAAKAYCEWLTKQYSLQRKRTYTQVVFRLPTELEWRTAAGSGDPKAITPFPNNSIKNSSDCYLANIQPIKGRFFDDGGFHQVKVNSYQPNKLGIYNTFGNVSEMTSTKGTALGGSWFDLFEDCTFDKKQAYSSPMPTIGFRIVMEIIER